jgi:hypothetical protein
MAWGILRERPADDFRRRNARDRLAALYRSTGREAAAEALR